jgi:hypothetical protein
VRVRFVNEDGDVRRILDLSAWILFGLAFMAWPVFERPVSWLSPRQDSPRVHAPSSGHPQAVRPAALPAFDSDGEPNTDGPSWTPALPGGATGAGTLCLTGAGRYAAGCFSTPAGPRLPHWGSALPPPSRHSA